MGGTKPNARFQIPIYNDITDSTVTDANTQRTHLTERRTQAIAQRTPLGGLYRTYGNGHGPNWKHTTVRHNYGHRTGATLDTKHCHTRAAALQYLANQIHKLRPLSYVTRDV